MAGNLSDGEDEITDINVTPLVDVMLVLLVIFMVTASYITSQSIEVNLPSAETGEPDSATRHLAFVIDSDSNLYLDGAAIDYTDLEERVLAFRQEEANLQAVIAADQQTPHGAVIKLIDAIRKNGITDFAINVESTP